VLVLGECHIPFRSAPPEAFDQQVSVHFVSENWSQIPRRDDPGIIRLTPQTALRLFSLSFITKKGQYGKAKKLP
jgi:hypothetical protein